MPLLPTIAPNEDSENQSVAIESYDSRGNKLPDPDLTTYDNIKLEVRDSKKNLIATYDQSSNTVQGGAQPYKLRIDSNDPSSSTNQDNVLNFDLYRTDTAQAVQGDMYANVELILNATTDYPQGYIDRVKFLVFAKMGA
jgi:hypothetical protein